MLAQLGITVHIRGPLTALERLGRLETAKVLRGLRKPAKGDQLDHRRKQVGPQGPWPRLAPSTLERYAKMGRRRNRRMLGRLSTALMSSVSPTRLKITSRVKWAMAHQDGPTRVGRGSVVPQRQFLWISGGLEKTVKKHFQDALYAKWKR